MLVYASCLVPPASPLPSHPPPFLRPLPGSCLAFPLSALGLTLSFSWKVWHMEDDTTRPKESVSLAAVANMGDELVCPLPQSHFGPLVGRAFVHHLPSFPPHPSPGYFNN